MCTSNRYMLVLFCTLIIGLTKALTPNNDKLHNFAERENFSSQPNYKAQCRPTVYFSSPLYNAGESMLNIDIVNILETSFNVDFLLPQRDGFDFPQLFRALALTSPPQATQQELMKAAQLCVFFLNTGVFLQNSDVVLSRLDEPRDSKITVELVYANMIGIPVAIWRTDSRTPFGSPQDELQGAPFYPILNAETYTYRFISASTRSEDATYELWAFSEALSKSIRSTLTNSQCDMPLPAFAKHIPFVQLVSRAAHLLFGMRDIKTIVRMIHTEEGLSKVARAYWKSRAELESIYPRVL